MKEQVSPEEQITLRCRVCKQTRRVKRLSFDYPEAVVIETLCDTHHPGDRVEEFYFDANGKHITRDPEEPCPSN